MAGPWLRRMFQSTNPSNPESSCLRSAGSCYSWRLLCCWRLLRPRYSCRRSLPSPAPPSNRRLYSPWQPRSSSDHSWSASFLISEFAIWVISGSVRCSMSKRQVVPWQSGPTICSRLLCQSCETLPPETSASLLRSSSFLIHSTRP